MSNPDNDWNNKAHSHEADRHVNFARLRFGYLGKGGPGEKEERDKGDRPASARSSRRTTCKQKQDRSRKPRAPNEYCVVGAEDSVGTGVREAISERRSKEAQPQGVGGQAGRDCGSSGRADLPGVQRQGCSSCQSTPRSSNNCCTDVTSLK